MKTISTVFACLLLTTATAVADEGVAGRGLAEASGGYGAQLGEQPYVPVAGGGYKHPLTNGYVVGVALGYDLVPGIALTGNWDYAASQSRNGAVTNALDTVEGTISYHTLALGLRWTRDVGPGRLFGEAGAGVILPFETVVHYDYAPAMSTLPAPVTGTGRMIDEYNLGFGAYGQAGYQYDLSPRLYLSAGVRLRSFQSNNDGQETRFENFVGDFTQPQAMNAAVSYDSDGTAGTLAPVTYSVQELRAQLALGFRL